MVELSDLPVMTEPSRAYLNALEREDYRSEREDCLEWLLTFGKDSDRVRGYARGTVEPRSYRMDRFYRWVWERKLEISQRRDYIDDPEDEAFLNQRAGAESMINEMYHRTGKRTKFTGTIKVKNATTAKAIGTNPKRVSRHLNEESGRQKTAG